MTATTPTSSYFKDLAELVQEDPYFDSLPLIEISAGPKTLSEILSEIKIALERIEDDCS
jgi:hypothetical protein